MSHTWRSAVLLLAVIFVMQCCSLNASDLLNPSATATIAGEATLSGVTIPTQLSATSIPLPTLQPSKTPQQPATYDVVQTVTLVNNGPINVRIQFNLALIQDLPPYQQLDSIDISPATYEKNSDELGNQYARFEIPQLAAGETQVFTARYRVVVNPVGFELDGCTGDMPGEFTSPETYIESDSQQVVDLAVQLGEGKSTVCDKGRAYYDYIADHLTYYGYRADEIGALATLSQGTGDCTDYADVMIALSRAAGIPARFVEGVTCCTTNGYVEGGSQHDWLELYLPPTGWVPVDPTWGQPQENRDLYFAAMTPDHIVVTRGQNLQALEGYHYWYYRWWTDEGQPDISDHDEWSILLAP